MNWILMILFVIVSTIVQQSLNNKIKKYSKVALPNGMTGADIARKMLRDNGINDVTVTHIPGRLTDNYNPMAKTVNLSEDVYHSCSIAAAAVAAHECGHALQHATQYTPLKIRSSLVPIVSFSSNIMSIVIIIGLLLINVTTNILLVGIILYALTTLFAFITLPVEINASKRAINWLLATGITNNQTSSMAESALRSAAYTYVVNALCSLATLFYYITIFNNRR